MTTSNENVNANNAADEAAAKKAAAKKAREARAAAKKSETQPAETAPAETAPAEEPVVQNGVVYPKAKSEVFALWELANKLSSENERPVTLAELTAAGAESFTESVIKAEFKKWCKFYGIEVAKAEKAPKAEKASKPAKLEQNGVKRPYSDTKCGAIWDLADSMSAELQRPVTTKELVEKGVALGMNKNNVMGEHWYWKKFHGVATVRASADPAKAADTLAKLKEKRQKLDEQILALETKLAAAAKPVESEVTEISDEDVTNIGTLLGGDDLNQHII